MVHHTQAMQYLLEYLYIKKLLCTIITSFTLFSFFAARPAAQPPLTARAPPPQQPPWVRCLSLTANRVKPLQAPHCEATRAMSSVVSQISQPAQPTATTARRQQGINKNHHPPPRGMALATAATGCSPMNSVVNGGGRLLKKHIMTRKIHSLCWTKKEKLFSPLNIYPLWFRNRVAEEEKMAFA